MLHHWHKALDEGQSVRILFVDYAKAFDHVDRCVILQKMRTYGVPDITVRWLTSFLCERQQRVKICDIFSDWVTLRGGMPQGTWLGPLTFTILIVDLRPGLSTHKYVDDTTVTEIIEKGSVSEMQNTTATLVEWSELNSMNINTRKTKEIVMGSCGSEMNTLMISSTAVDVDC